MRFPSEKKAHARPGLYPEARPSVSAAVGISGNLCHFTKYCKFLEVQDFSSSMNSIKFNLTDFIFFKEASVYL